MLFLVAVLILGQTALCTLPPVRVALQFIGQGCRRITLQTEGDLALRPLDKAQPPIDAPGSKECVIQWSDGAIQLGARETAKRIEGGLRVEAAQGGILRLTAPGKPPRAYLGALEIRVQRDHLVVVNELDLEDYLSCVVPAEMPPSYRPEALKAQAVAARTYAVSRRGSHAREQADLCDGPHCQVYTGADARRPATSTAVADTRGLVALWQGKPIQALYSGDCGGCTRDSGRKDAPYLASVRDNAADGGADYCAAGPKHTWTLDLNAGELKALISKRRDGDIGEMKGFEVTESDLSGRAVQLRITGEKGEVVLSGEEFRQLCGLSVLPGTRFSVTALDQGGWRITGSGAGHGVGMCQEGANGMAGPPFNLGYVEILQHYYRGIEVMPLP